MDPLMSEWVPSSKAGAKLLLRGNPAEQQSPAADVL